MSTMRDEEKRQQLESEEPVDEHICEYWPRMQQPGIEDCIICGDMREVP